MTNWVERLKGESQARLLYLLRRSSLSITDLAKRLKLTDNAVRSHVAALERDGLVELAGIRRETGGKPARLYRLTSEGEELLPKAYAMVLGDLIEEISSQDGKERALLLLSIVGRRAAERAGHGRSGEDRVTAAAAALRGLGGDVEVRQEESGWLLRGFGCPLSAVTAEHPEVCELARALVEQITGRPVTECCDRTSRPQCGFRIAP